MYKRQAQIVADEQNGHALALHLQDAVEAFGLEVLVADGQNLIDDQDLGAHVDGDGEAQAHVHARRIMLDRHIDVIAQFGEVQDVVKKALGLLAAEAQHRGIEIDILAPGEVGVEARAQFQQGADAAMHPDFARGGLDNAGDQLEKGALAAAVAADDAHAAPRQHVEGDVAHSPQIVGNPPPPPRE